jgi:hypothetical protein
MRIQTIDIDQPPGIDIALIVDMDEHQRTVTATLAAKSAPEMPRNARADVRPSLE